MALSHDHTYDSLIADTCDKRVEAQRQRLDGSAAIKPIKRNIANRAVKQMCKIIFGILKSAFPKKNIRVAGSCDFTQKFQLVIYFAFFYEHFLPDIALSVTLSARYKIPNNVKQKIIKHKNVR